MTMEHGALLAPAGPDQRGRYAAAPTGRGAHDPRRPQRPPARRYLQVAAIVLAGALAAAAVLLLMGGDRRWRSDASAYLPGDFAGLRVDRDDPVATGQSAAFDAEKYGLDTVVAAGYRPKPGATPSVVLVVASAKPVNVAGMERNVDGTQRQQGATRSTREVAGVRATVYEAGDPAQPSVTVVALPRPDVLVVVTTIAGSAENALAALEAALDAGSR